MTEPRTAMRCFHSVFLLAGVLLPLLSTAQQTWPRGTVGLQVGGLVLGGHDAWLSSERLRLAPGSALLPMADTLADTRWGTYSDNGSALAFEFGIFPFRTEERKGPELRVGLLSMGMSVREELFSSTTRSTVDTLVSPTTGNYLVIDSISTRRLEFVHDHARIGVSGALIWSTQGRWSLSAGVGLNGGALVNARTEVRYRESHYGGFPAVGMGGDTFSERVEHYRNAAGWWAGFHLPFGISCALSRRHAVLSQLRVGYEYSWSLHYEQFVATESEIRTGNRHMLGLRYAF